MKEIYRINTGSEAVEANVVQRRCYRITVLTEGLVRLEYSEDGIFEDRKTQVVFYRDFPPVDYRILQREGGIEIITSRFHLHYDEQEFSEPGLYIQVTGNMISRETWRYGEEIRDLKGTARTLDEVDGAVPLESGLMSKKGYSVLDDSESLVLQEDGWVEPRKKGVKDIYFFGYGHDYKVCLKDFYRLCGKTPMLPRFVLGNWWSRYYKYTEESYMALMDRFDAERLPFSVAVIDMDWHLVDIDPKYGSGWTGYTWNEEYFPDPARFLSKLKDRGMHTTLNVHPADGVRAFEKPYLEFGKAMGVNIQEEEPVFFDASNPKFIEEYFRCVFHPLEEQGVDFWWVDWQQGKNSKVEGLDPLWILNHFHFLDSKRQGKRPMTFSRYAGPGSHRYPVGFSGDSITTWESLDFQPYFTASASNIGYGWWSHDIGGHMFGYQDNEMMARWTWFGIFSPIMRLHCSNSIFNGKEPWRYGGETEKAMGEALRLRHRMLPYLYTMNYRSYEEGLPIVLPMYYEHPEDKRAYEVPNQYYFGSSLLVAPITSKRIPKLHVAKVTAFLPEGKWYDVFTGQMYAGDRMIDFYRDINSIPVLAKAGTILPLTDSIYGTDATTNPESLHIQVYAGAEGSFTLYEDDNETCDYEKGSCAKTQMTYRDKDSFVILPTEGDETLLPQLRTYVIEFIGYQKGVAPEIRVNGKLLTDQVSWEYCEKKRVLQIKICKIPVKAQVDITLSGAEAYAENKKEQRVFDFLSQAEIEFDLKDEVYQLVCKKKEKDLILSSLMAINLDPELLGVLTELIAG